MRSTPIVHFRARRSARVSSVAAVLLALLLGLTALLTPATARHAMAADPVRVRIGVVKDGITIITPAHLTEAGVDLASVDPRSFALTSLGQPVAIHVTGEADGRFDGGDRLYFFGEKFRGVEMDQKYTDERVYWLDIGGVAGPRIPSLGADPLYDRTPPANFGTTLRAEESMQWWTLHTLWLDTQDTWFWARLNTVAVGSGQAVTATMPSTVPHPAPATSASFRMEAISRQYSYALNPDHRTTVTFNGKPIIDQLWDGLHVRKVFTATLAPGDFNHGVNTVNAGAWNLPGLASDDVYVNYWELDYRRLFRAFGGQIDFKAENAGVQEYEIDGWDAPDVWIWDVSDPLEPTLLDLGTSQRHRLFLPLVTKGGGGGAPATGLAAGGFKLRFRATGQVGSRYWLQAAPTFQAPASIRLHRPTGLRSPAGGADAVLVTSAELRPAAERLAQWHRDHGRRALVVDIQDAYDEFNEGIYHPKAVQTMMKWAVANWQAPAPAYLTLVGDGHWNFKGYNPAAYPPQPNNIPPYLAWVDPWQGEVPTDALFGDVNDDRIPEIAVGRLAVNTLAEAQSVVDKIVTYDEDVRTADWQRRALFVADNPDGAGDFPRVSDEIITGYTPTDLQIIRAYLPGDATTPATPDQIAATRAIISDTLQSGAFMVQYTGHGAPERWANELIWRATDIPGLLNGAKLPLVMTFNCLDGYFAYPVPTSFSLAELMQRRAGGGSIAAISPSGLGVTSDQQAFRKILLDVMFKDNVREVGRALTIAKKQFSQVYGKHYLIDTMTLFGDPAMRLPAQTTQ